VPYRRKKLTFAISSPDELLFKLLLHVCCIYANKDTAVYSSYVKRGVFSGVLQSENLTSNALTQNTRTRLAVIDNLCRGRRAVPLQTITTRHSSRKQTTDEQTDDGRNGDSIGL